MENDKSPLLAQDCGICLLDAEGRIVFSNPALEKMLICSAEQLEGQPLVGFVGADDTGSCTAILDELVAGGRDSRSQRVHFSRQDGEAFLGECTISRVTEAALPGTFLLATLEDVSLRGRSAVLLDALNAAATAMGSALSLEAVFAAVAAELRKVGFSSILFTVDADKGLAYPTYMSHESKALAAAEKLAGVGHQQFSIRVGSFPETTVFESREAAFVPNTAELLERELPRPARVVSRRVVELLEMKRTIVAPVVVNDAVVGVFALQANDLVSADMPAVMVFAQQLSAAWARTELVSESLGRQERLRQMFDNMSTGVAVYEAVDDGADFLIKEFNRAAEQASHARGADVVGRRVTEVFPGVKDLGLFEVFQRVWHTGEAEHHPTHLYRDDRIAFWTENYVFRLPTGEVVALFDDVSARTRAEEALRGSEERFRTITEQTSDTVFITDSQGFIAYLSPAAKEMFGAEAHEREGRHFAEMLAPGYMERALSAFAEAVNTGQPTRGLELGMKRKDGSVFFGELTASLYTTGSFAGTAGTIRDVTERRRTMQELQIASHAIEHAGIGVLRMDREGRVREVNEYMSKLLGYSREELLLLRLYDFSISANVGNWSERWKELKELGSVTFERDYRTKSGEIVPVEISVSIIDFEGVEYTHAFIRDITERRAAERDLRERDERLLQAQKMESVGRLAGGVAHDYNNMLGVILGHADLALMEIDPTTPLYADIEEIKKAAQRSADLTRQLLTFARKQTAAPRVIDLNSTVEDLLQMLRRLIREDIELDWIPGAALWPLNVDPVQVDQILTNLCVNARDAISDGGRITIGTENVTLDEAYLGHHPGCVPGEYVKLAVSDDGRGMEADVLEHLFEPFFTTKDVGQGTGLGLATVFGIATQNRGFIDAQSEPQKGSVLSVYLPRFIEAVTSSEASAEREAIEDQGGTVLLVEDESAILKMAERILRGLGYSVLAAATPGEALRLAEAHPGDIRLLVTDVVMPGMNGQALAERIGVIKPGVKCLLMSGYAADVISSEGVIGSDVHFIQKPFTVDGLAAKVSEALRG
jgi:PAS domain S-box-containing protein